MQPVEGLFSSDDEGDSSDDNMTNDGKQKTESKSIGGENLSSGQTSPDNRKRDADELESESGDHDEGVKGRLKRQRQIPKVELQHKRCGERQKAAPRDGRPYRGTTNNCRGTVGGFVAITNQTGRLWLEASEGNQCVSRD
ncbi:hypothetical protein LZ31DRAFT_250588 [Colletotrichum somersetense]|nr:hypothetical protein LZ31DRAFT_250588 [Colletotrichum somersetense]